MNSRLYTDTITLQGAPLEGENPLPFFRASNPDLPVFTDSGFPERLRHSFGRETAFRMLPYRRQDRYGRELKELSFPAIILENDFLRAEFIPSLGGRLWRLFDKRNKRDVVYTNSVFRPANLAIREAWFSGGIEWNLGRFGHAVHTASPLFSGSFKDADGTPIFRIWDFERQNRLYWVLDAFLPADSSQLLVYVRVINPDKKTKPVYWWTNTAARETPGVRILAPTDQVLYLVTNGNGQEGMGGGILPELDTLPGGDSSYPGQIGFSNEYFFQCADSTRNGKAFLWEAAAYEDGYVFFEQSTPPLSYRKMFCWGTGRGGQKWQDFLSLPGERYLEVQAGLAPSQLHTAEIGPEETIDWAQGFGALSCDPKRCQANSYREALAYMGDTIADTGGSRMVRSALERGQANQIKTPTTLYTLGSGFGYLESRLADTQKRKGPPAGLVFPETSLGKDELPWLELLKTGRLPDQSPSVGPGAFVGQEYLGILENALTSQDALSWLVPYHAGVLLYEGGEKQKAIAYWNQSLSITKNAWALRNLAVAAEDEGNIQSALNFYREAMELPEGKQTSALTEEYVAFLMIHHMIREAAPIIKAHLRKEDYLSGALLNAAALMALEEEDDDLFDRLLSREPSRIREGENTLSDLWFEREARRLAKKDHITLELARGKIAQEAQKGTLMPPESIDFRKSIGGQS